MAMASLPVLGVEPVWQPSTSAQIFAEPLRRGLVRALSQVRRFRLPLVLGPLGDIRPD